MITMYEVMKSINNFFTLTNKAKYGTWKIDNGALSLPFLVEGQYYLIEGSDFNDYTIHQRKTGFDNLVDEEFTGWITPLAVPSDFVDICNKIKEYMTNEVKDESALISESFGGYSYTKGSHSDGTPWGWADAFRCELNAWRKI